MPEVTKPKASKNKTLVQFDTTSDRSYIKHNGTKVYLFDKRFKTETPTKAYLKILEDVLKKNKSAIFHLNNKALNTTPIISLLNKYNIDISKYRKSVDKIRGTLKLYKNLRVENLECLHSSIGDMRNIINR